MGKGPIYPGVKKIPKGGGPLVGPLRNYELQHLPVHPVTTNHVENQWKHMKKEITFRNDLDLLLSHMAKHQYFKQRLEGSQPQWRIGWAVFCLMFVCFGSYEANTVK